MKNLIITILYGIGVLLLLVTGIQELNWIVYLAILIGIIGLAYSLYDMKKSKE